MKSDHNIPNRLVFSPGSSKKRNRTYVLVTILGLVQLCLIWPVFPLFGSPDPFIFGFPLNVAWVILMVLIAFVALLTFFVLEHRGKNN
ncbi:MAG: hypothetical protein AAFW89_03100 [Bacteroidota bacterium]